MSGSVRGYAKCITTLWSHLSLPLEELHFVSSKLAKLNGFFSEKTYRIHVCVMRAQCQCYNFMPSLEGYSFNMFLIGYPLEAKTAPKK